MKRLSILVVDDDLVIRRLLEQRMKQKKHVVRVAQDGFEAEKLLKSQYFDLVLTDLMMPGGISGIEVLDISKRINENTEVIVITAHSSIDSAVAAMKKGAIDYLEKPINFDELFLRIEKIISFKSIIKNAEDLQQAKDITENEASRTIQDLEMKSAQLQQQLDDVEAILKKSAIDPQWRITSALEKITGA